MTNKTFIESLKNAIAKHNHDFYINALDNLLWTFNDYAQENNPDDYIWENCDTSIDEMLTMAYGDDLSPIDAINIYFYGKVNKMDQFIKFNGYGNLESLHYSDFFNLYIDNNDFINYCDKNAINLESVSKGQ
jgi:hypothetical protein